MNETDSSLREQLSYLQERHRELDTEISRLQDFPYQDQLQLRRMKKEKLRLKESIQRLRTLLIPDLDA